MAGASRATSVATVFLMLLSSGRASGLGAEADSICGSPEIWRTLTRDTSVEGVRNIKWSLITAKAADYIAMQKLAIDKLNAEIEALDLSIQASMKKEQASPTTKDQLTELVHAASVAYGDVKTAQSTWCGKPGRRPRQKRDAYVKSQEAFKSAAAELFNGEVRLAGDFDEVCRDLLIGQEPEEGNYCPQLCQRLKDEAQQLSDRSVGALGGRTSEDLIKQRYAAVEAMAKANKEIASCEQAQDNFAKLEASIKDNSGEADKRFNVVQDAEWDLEDARWNLTDVQEEVKQQEAILQEILKTLEETGANVDDAKKAFEAVLEQEGALKTKVVDTDASLVSVQEKLAAAKSADKVIDQLRSAVSAIAEKMHLLFDKTVLTPVRELGIHETLSLDDYFHKDAGALQSAGMVRETVDALDGFCKGDAKASFAAVADQIDLSPLCRIGDAAGIKTEITAAVQDRVKSVRDSIEEVKAWFDPFHGQESISPEQIAQFVANGEPEGLRRVMSVYSSAGFYQYLQGWKVKGQFLTLIAKLKQVIGALDDSANALEGDLVKFKDQLKSTIQAREEAKKKLDDAMQRHGIEEHNKETLKGKLAELDEQSGKLKHSIEEFERAVEDARKKWAAAKQMILDTYNKATSFLESLPEQEPSAMLEFKSVQAQHQMAALRDELESAKLAHATINAKMAAAKAA